MRARPVPRTWPSPTRQLLVLLGLTGFAISQPLLGVLGDAPTILARHGIEGWDLVWLGVVVAFGPPLLLWAVTRVVAMVGDRVGSGWHIDRPLHLMLVGSLVACFTIQLAKAVGASGSIVLLGVATLAAIAFVVLYVRKEVVATWASYTAILPFLAVASLLLVSPASALLTSTAAPARVTGGEDLPSVVMIVLDELPTRAILDPEGGIDEVRFPNLATFAGDATWYRHFSTQATLTEAAVPAMLTGSRPVGEAGLWTNHPDNLFTLLGPTHELEVIEQATRLCPWDGCAPTAATGAVDTLDLGGPGFRDLLGVTRELWFDRIGLADDESPGFDDFAEGVASADPTTATTSVASTPSVTEAPADEPTPIEAQALVSVRADALRASFDAAKGPALYYLHLMLPHQPFERYPDGTEYEVIDPAGEELPAADRKHVFSWSPWTSAVSEQQQLLQVQYSDQVLGQLVDGLRDAGLYDESLVIVASDHGISFEAESEPRYIEPSTVDAIAYAPLLVKQPGQTSGAVDDTNVMGVDVLPTIADSLGIDVPWEIDGAAIGSPAIARRGGAKQIYDMDGFGSGLRVERIIDFDDGETFDTVSERFIGPLPDPDDPLSGLHERLGIEDLIGRDLDGVVTGRAGGAVVFDQLARLREPGDPPALGLATGQVSGASDDTTLLIAVDGVVVGGSATSTDADGRSGLVAVLLAQGVLGEVNEIRAARLEGGEVLELDVRSR